MSDDHAVLTISKLRHMIASVEPIEPNAGEIIESVHMVDGPFEDWSQVRSPGRARRRRRQGHAQRIRYYTTPRTDFVKLPGGALVGHPQTVRAFYAKIRAGMERKSDEIVRRAFYGSPI